MWSASYSSIGSVLMDGAVRKFKGQRDICKLLFTLPRSSRTIISYYLIPLHLKFIVGLRHTTKRLSNILTCKWCVGEMLWLAALSLAVNDVEVHFD